MAFTIVSVVLGLVLGLVLGGRPRNVGRRPLGWLVLLAAGIAAQVTAEATDVGDPWALALVLASYVLLGAFVLVNLRIVGMPVVLVGLALNVAVVTANGEMPVRGDAIVAAGITDADGVDGLDFGAKRSLEVPGHRLVVLGDIIPVPPLREVLSFGDLVLAAGVTNVIFRLLRPRTPRARERGAPERSQRVVHVTPRLA